jgi:hypothetical protein
VHLSDLAVCAPRRQNRPVNRNRQSGVNERKKKAEPQHRLAPEWPALEQICAAAPCTMEKKRGVAMEDRQESMRPAH